MNPYESHRGYYHAQLYNGTKPQQDIDRVPVFESMERFVCAMGNFSHTMTSTLRASELGLSALLQLTHQYHTVKQTLSGIYSLLSRLRKRKDSLLQWHRPSTFSAREFEMFCSPSKTSKGLLIPILLSLTLLGVPILVQYYSSLNKHCLQQQICAKNDVPIDMHQVKPSLTTKNKLDFARALYTFHAESCQELGLKPNDLIAVISKADTDWWYGRLKNGKRGYFPVNHVEIIEKKAIPDTKEPSGIATDDIAPSAYLDTQQ